MSAAVNSIQDMPAMVLMKSAGVKDPLRLQGAGRAMRTHIQSVCCGRLAVATACCGSGGGGGVELLRLAVAA